MINPCHIISTKYQTVKSWRYIERSTRTIKYQKYGLGINNGINLVVSAYEIVIDIASPN